MLSFFLLLSFSIYLSVWLLLLFRSLLLNLLIEGCDHFRIQTFELNEFNDDDAKPDCHERDSYHHCRWRSTSNEHIYIHTHIYMYICHPYQKNNDDLDVGSVSNDLVFVYVFSFLSSFPFLFILFHRYGWSGCLFCLFVSLLVCLLIIILLHESGQIYCYIKSWMSGRGQQLNLLTETENTDPPKQPHRSKS